MGLQNWFNRTMMSTWFREISVIDTENLPKDRGAVMVSWHPGGLYDKMLTKGMIPGEQIYFDGIINDDTELDLIATKVANGANVVVFPEGESHESPKPNQIRDCAAKIAFRSAELAGDNKPVIVPIGIHYSRKYYFRERVALTIERPIEITGSIKELSSIISSEISRASHSSDNWQDRVLIWKARSIIRAERFRTNPEMKQRVSYGEEVLGARRVRAAWEWFAKENPDSCKLLEDRTKEHMSKLESFSLKPRYIDSRPKSVTNKGFILSIWWLLFAWSFMLGFVTISAIIGSLPPLLVVVAGDKLIGSKLSQSRRGAMKLYISFAAYPIWWAITAWAFTWTLTSDGSPLAKFAEYSVILEFLFAVPGYAVFPLLLWWMPMAGKLQLTLQSKATIAWRRMRLWVMWRNPAFDWDKLCDEQRRLAFDLVKIGDNLVLPGDDDWIEPSPGMEDFTSVSQRQ